MIRPDAIPLRAAASRVTLPPEAVTELFGQGYRWRGSERVRLVGTGQGEVAINAVAGARLVLEVDRLDAATLGRRTSRIVGPRGSIDAAEITSPRRMLVLPGALIRAWGLEVDQRVVLEVGPVLFTDVEVAEGEPAGAALDRADLIAADAADGGQARLRRDVAPDEPVAPAGDRSIPGRLITENDVRQARLRGRRITVQPGQKVTPAALSLGKELGILDH